jgi:mannose-6-phosphate isomerase-like protein (cupin superfamily)
MQVRHIPDRPGEGKLREKILFDRPETETICLGRVLVAPGESSPLGFHDDEEEIYVILSGRATLRIGEETCEVGPGDVAYVPRNHVHQLTCLSTEPLEYLYFANWPQAATG